MVDRGLIALQVGLTERAGGGDDLGARVDGVLQQVAHRLYGCRAIGDHESGAAAPQLVGIRHRVGPGGPQQLLEVLRVVDLHLVEPGPPGPHDLAPVVGRHLQALELLVGLAANGLQRLGGHEGVHDVADLDVPLVVQVVGLEGVVHVLGEVGIALQGGVGGPQVLVAGVARGDDVQTLLLGDGQVAGAQDRGQQLVDVGVGRGAAAVPVFEFLQFDAQLVGHLHGGHVVGGRHGLQRAAGVVGVAGHSMPSRGRTRATMDRRLWIRLIREGRSGIRPLARSFSPICISRTIPENPPSKMKAGA